MDREAPTVAEYKRQHFVSKVVQWRFTASAGPAAKRLAQLRRADPSKVELVGPRNTLKEDWFIEAGAAPERFEKIWGQAEDGMSAVFAEIDAHRGTTALSPASAGRIADFMALHLIRSPATKRLWERSRTVVVPRRRAGMLANRNLINLARSTGLYPPEWSDEQIVDDITATVEDPLQTGGEAFGDTLVELYDSVRKRFTSLHVEVGEAVDGQFVLPDVPCVPYRAESGDVGLLAGFGLNASEAIVMPLGPRHIVSLVTREPDRPWLQVDAASLSPINDALARVAIGAAYLQPDSGLERTIRTAWMRQAGSR